MQLKSQLEEWYTKADPWSYTVNPEDHKRKNKILLSIPKKVYKRAIDIGAGEGWLTQHLPAENVYGYEISDTASSRFPSNVKRAKKLSGEYDLILATGVFYEQYDYEEMHYLIHKHLAPGGTLVTSNIKSWEKPIQGLNQIYEEEYPYREYTQRLAIYEKV